MPALLSNPELLIDALLREARDQPNPFEWTRALQRCYFLDWKTGDEFAANISAEGSTTAWLREIPSNIGAQLCERALKTLEAELAAAAAGLTGTPSDGMFRGADFSSGPSTLG